MAKKGVRNRRRYNGDLRAKAVQMMLDDHSAASGESRLGIHSAAIRCRQGNQLTESGPVATALMSRVQQFEKEPRRVEQEPDI